jgi:hypothetical protein
MKAGNYQLSAPAFTLPLEMVCFFNAHASFDELHQAAGRFLIRFHGHLHPLAASRAVYYAFHFSSSTAIQKKAELMAIIQKLLMLPPPFFAHCFAG